MHNTTAQTTGAAADGALTSVLSGVSYFRYADGLSVLQNGWVWENNLLLIAVAVVAIVAALWRFERRDIEG